MRLTALLLALSLVACDSKKPDPAPQGPDTAPSYNEGPADSVWDSVPRPAPAPAPAPAPVSPRRGGAAPVRAETTTVKYLDSIRVGDTTTYERGRKVQIAALYIDTTWTVGPAPGRLIFSNGPWWIPGDSLCKDLGHSATHFNITRTVAADLAKVKSCGATATVAPPRRFAWLSGKGLDVPTGLRYLGTWDGLGYTAALRKAQKDSTLTAIMIGDDIESETEWGPAGYLTRLARYDTLACAVRAKVPGAAVTIRALATQLSPRPVWQCLTTAWAQYNGPRRHGHPEAFAKSQVAAAKSRQLALIMGVNTLNGGCGPFPSICVPGIPGSPVLGTYADAATVHRYQLSPEEYLYYKTVFLNESYICASRDWEWSPIYESGRDFPAEQLRLIRAFNSLPAVRANALALGLIAKGRPFRSCVLPA
jgi:hypothetical protein